MISWNIEGIAPGDLRDAIRARLGFTRDETYGWRDKDGQPAIPHDPTADLSCALAEIARLGATHYGVSASPIGWAAFALRNGQSVHTKGSTARFAAVKVIIALTEECGKCE